MIVLLMGVAGSGKTTIGTLLASAMGCPFLEGDALHPAANVDRMRRGIPLSDADRAPWLAAIRAHVADAFERGDDLVVGCSALKHAYRRTIGEGIPVTWVYLRGSPALLEARLERRRGHFMKADMLASQLASLEEPSGALVVDVTESPHAIVERILAELGRRTDADVRIAPTLDELGRRAAEASVEEIDSAVRARGRCSILLSGGSTPRGLHGALAADLRDRIPWRDVHVFWGDERYVPHGDARSNYRMAAETLLDHVPCPAENVHPMPTHLPSMDGAARSYEETLRSHFGTEWPSFDVAFMGMGEDGHTASLFPGLPGIEEAARWVIAVAAPAEPPRRLTLTLPALLRSVHTHVLVAGATKSGVLRQVLTGAPDPRRWPAAGLRCTEGSLTWWVDRAAAADYARTRAS